MVSLDHLCRFCLTNAENDSSKLLIKISEDQKDKFEELTSYQLPLTDEYPLNVCTDCTDNLENFYFFKNQLIRKQNDLNLFLGSSIVEENLQSLIEFDDEIEIFEGSQEEIEALENNDLLPVEDKSDETTVYREELKFESINPKLVLFASDLNKGVERVTSILESPLIVENKFTCESCNLVLKSKLPLERHLKEQHKSEEKFICPTCGNIYRNKTDLRSHLRSHNLNKKYKCTYADCTKAFRHQHHLVNHLRVHNKSSPFACDDCEKTFRQKYALKLHIKKHKKDFIECSKCKSQFLRKIQLTKHIENNLCDGKFRPYIIRINNKKNKS